MLCSGRFILVESVGLINSYHPLKPHSNTSISFPGIVFGGPGRLNDQISTMSNNDLKKCVNSNGYILPE